MADKLTLRNTGTLLIVYFGLFCITGWLVRLGMAWLSARGGGVDIDSVAASTALALKGIAAGVVILAIGVIARLCLKSGKPRAQ